MNKLKDSICYLVGAIDFCEDQGVTWRKSLIEQCGEFGIKFLDPTDKIKGLQAEVGSEQEYIKNLKHTKQWDSLKKFMKMIVRQDHRCVDISDFIIMYINTETHMCGSYFELRSALSQKKPYFVIVEGGKAHAPNWLFGILDHNCIYDDIASVIARLREIDQGCELSDRWLLIRDKLKEL